MALQLVCAHALRAILSFCLLTATFGCGDSSGTASVGGDVSGSTNPPPSSPPLRNSITLSWTPPTENTDGSYLDDIAGYKIYSGPSPHNLAPRVTLDGPGLSRYVVEPIGPDELYFAITTLNSKGQESELSGVVKVPS